MVDQSIVERHMAGMRYEFERTAPPDGFPQFPIVPAGRYTDPTFLALEREYLWKKSWLYAGHADELPKPGDFMMWQKTGSPIVLVHGKDGVIRAFYNSCRHRGAPLVQTECGHVDGFVCKYHGWTYGLDGKLLNLRDKRDFPNLDLSAYPMNEVRCERLGKWIFVNEDPNAEPLLQHLGPIPAYLDEIKPHEQRFVHKKAYHVKCNVKVLLDAFLEVYHLKSIHQNTVDRFLDHRGTTISLWGKGHSYMLTPNRRPDWEDPGTRGLYKLPTNELIAKNNPSFHMYPNLVTPVADSGIPFLLFWPSGDREMFIEVHWFSPDWGDGPIHPLWEKRIENFERILYEDTQFAEQIQISVESPGFKGMNLNYQERRIYHWHEELDRRIGIERVPKHLRVEPLLGAYVGA